MKMILVFAAALLLAGCSSGEAGSAQESISEAVSSAETHAGSYKQISQEEAAEMMTRDDGHIIVDVRRQDEYDAGHIPGAVLIPNESILSERPEQLSDTSQIILVYCRSGRRSKEASQKLADMGYTNVYEFGGIITWKGETVTE